MSTILVVAAIETNDFLTLLEVNSGEFAIASFNANPLNSRLLLVEVNVGNETLRCNASSNVGHQITTVILAIESIRREHYRSFVVLRGTEERTLGFV